MRWRTRLAQAFFVAVVALQAHFVVAAYDDPHSHFGYQPFSQSSTWQATIVRVLDDGSRVDVREGWEGYSWPALVQERGLDTPWVAGTAPSGVESTLAFFQQALDYVATHTPRDTHTRYFEAQVHTVKNRRPRDWVLRSVERELP